MQSFFDLDNTLTHRDHSVQAYTHVPAETLISRRWWRVDLVQIKRIINRIDNGDIRKRTPYSSEYWGICRLCSTNGAELDTSTRF